jgi:trimethylamine---corrinoid protein Co-methyltransferase
MEEKPSVSGKQGQFRVLTVEQLQAIHSASLEVLRTTGYHAPVPEARRLVLDGGGKVSGERIYITQEMVEKALQTYRPVSIFDRTGKPSRVLSNGEVCFSTIADTFYVLDPYTKQVRPFLKADQRWLATVIDSLAGIDYVQCVGQAHDVPDTLQNQVAVAETVKQTSKPLLIYPYDRNGLLDSLEVIFIASGGEQNFLQKPSLMCAAVPAAPLSGTDYSLELLLTCAERQVPVLSYCCPAMGGNSPADIAATMVLANADWLASLVIHQLKRPGAPFCTAGCTMQLMDMHTSLWSYCAPETLLAYSAVTELAHWYGMPAFGLEMTCDGPQLDAQAGMEMMSQCQRAFLSGVEMVHNAGIYGAGKLCGAEAVILADEIIAYTRNAMKPLQVTDAKLAEAVSMINEAGPLGEYVSKDHTLAHFRDFWYPQIFNRGMFDPLSAEPGIDLHHRLNERARNCIENHRSALSDATIAEIDTLEAGWYKRQVSK